MTSGVNVKELAREGALVRLQKLEEQAAAIRRAFPGLSVNGAAQRRRKSHMSAKARKAQSERMKMYWASKRKAKAK